ncbi:hypothetical protein V1278_003061 [Bradyrhizobium sp. AZCC 1577]
MSSDDDRVEPVVLHDDDGARLACVILAARDRSHRVSFIVQIGHVVDESLIVAGMTAGRNSK